ncbi:MAG: P-II family nitrogen regulator [Syntrophomonadaceae bacterium]|jgi:nitrogen regulatory protein PII
MGDSSANSEIELLCIIVNFGIGSKILKVAKQNGLSGGTIFLAKGTVNNHVLQLLDLADIRKEIVLMIARRELTDIVLKELNHKFHFEKPNHGIAFRISVNNVFGIRSYFNNQLKESRGGQNSMHNAIFVVVDKGKAENVIEAATLAGSRGATVINARGSGIHENAKLFAMLIEPEKEIIMIIAEKKLTETITTSIRNHLKIDEPGKGIMFVLGIKEAYGLY